MDANEDELRFRLLYREVGSTVWSPLVNGLEENHFSFDTRQLTGGTYVIRIEAYDSYSNPPDEALTSSLDTKPFDVDNFPPRVEGLAATATGSSATVTFLASDDLSAIRIIRYKLDAGQWRVALPEDGITDSASEQVTVRLSGLEPGRHVITVQVEDELYNVGSGSTVLTVR